jgi:uncharacterized protein YjbJ (UPF0337 family)
MGNMTLGAANLAQRMNIQLGRIRFDDRKQMCGKDISISSRSNRILKNQSNSTKPQTNRRDIMKSGTRDQAEGKLHQAKGKIKEIAGKVSMDPDLEAAGKDENLDGKIQEKMGQVKKLVGK